MKIERIELHHIELPLVHPFETSFGLQTDRPCILVAVHAEGLTGWGECVAHSRPDYAPETNVTAWHVLADFLAPGLIGHPLRAPADIFSSPGYKMVRGHNMAKAALENAVWDLLARAQGVPLQTLLGASKTRVEVGVSIGIQPTLKDLLNRVNAFVAEGYGRIKIKIKPGWELAPLRAIRAEHPALKLMADANSAFTLADAPLFRQMEPLNLLMIEQPLAHDDIIDHSELQPQLNTPICLDESIHTPGDARLALKVGACRVINIKVGRVGGFSSAVAIHNICAGAGIPVWCGGMLETGIGRAANLHLAGLPNFTLPGDISATNRYYHEDIAEPAFSLNRQDSTLSVPQGTGLGVTVQPDRVVKRRQRHTVISGKSV
ncbi:MAG: o-succinylbenzoate synthase [Anaerolineae bacterium]